MIDFLLNPANLPFTIALGMMAGIGLLEGITTLMGFGASNFIESMIPDVDVDIDVDIDAGADVDIDADGGDLSDIGSAGALSRLWGWINVGRVPVLVLFVLFLFSFGVIGLIVQTAAQNTLGRLLPGLLASAAAFFPSVFFVRITSKLLSYVIPKDETEAVSENSFIGRIAVITIGKAQRSKPAQAKLRDQHGATHYVMVEPDNDEDVFEAGSEVLIVEQAGSVFRAISNHGIGHL